MSAFVPEQILTENDLNWYVTVAGTLTDQYEVAYQIWDIIDDPTAGTQIFPETAGDWEEVATNGRFAEGSYYTYDNAEGRGYQIPATARIGNHRVKWRWRSSTTSPYRYGQEDFAIVLEAGDSATYIEISDIRAEGLEDPPFTDDMILAAIYLWQEFLDRACRQWFLPKQLTVEFDGDDSFTAHFGVPIIDVEYLRINNSQDDLNSDFYKIYDNKRNPKIALVTNTQLSDIYTSGYLYNGLKFYKGFKNQIIRGRFGYVDDDLRPPKLIQRALTKLVIEKLTRPMYDTGAVIAPSSMTFAGVVIEEKTDGHSIKYGTASYNNRRVGLSGITQDQEILDIIRLYRAPIGIATPSHWSYY